MVAASLVSYNPFSYELQLFTDLNALLPKKNHSAIWFLFQLITVLYTEDNKVTSEGKAIIDIVFIKYKPADIWFVEVAIKSTFD